MHWHIHHSDNGQPEHPSEGHKLYNYFIMKYSFGQSIVIILFIQEVFSKSSDSNEFGVDSNKVNLEPDSNQFESEDNSDNHESYIPKDKYKIKSDDQDTYNRFQRNINEIQETNEIKTPQCAIMFKNNEPVGILQPFEDSYKFLPISGEPTVVDISPVTIKKKSIMDVLYPSNVEDEDYDDDYKAEDKVGFFDEKYPSIFAKFKIDSRLHKGTNKSPLKRQIETPSISENQLGSLKSTLSKMKSDDSIEVEDELKNILDDMGLIDDYPSDNEMSMKREVSDEKREIEDENLELGTNKINLIKETHRDLREKRDGFNSSIRESVHSSSMVKQMTDSVADLVKVENNNNNNHEVEECRSEKIDTLNNIQKRDQDTNSDEQRKKREKNDQDNDKNLSECSTINLAKENEQHQHEERSVREIRDRIQKLKEEVKKEIEQLRSFKNASDLDVPTRRKRQTGNSLIDEESKEIDPTFNDDNRRVHIRRKRKTTLQNSTNIDNENVSNGIIHQDLSGKIYRSRSLKQINSTDEKYKNIAIPNIMPPNRILMRRKREVKGVVDELEEESNDSEFNEEEKMDVPEDGLDKNNEIGYAQDNSKKNCNCDKNGNCKCDTSAMSGNSLSNFEDFSNLIDPVPLSKKSAIKSCMCDKNGNCKCGEQYSETANRNCECDNNGTCKCGNQYSEVANKNCECGKNGNCKCGGQYSKFAPSFNAQNDSIYNQYTMNKRSAKRQARTETRKVRNQLGKISNIENNSKNELKGDNLMKTQTKTHKFENGEYYVDLRPDVYKLTPEKNSRNKREDFDTLVAIHGGGPVINHLVAVRQRSMLPHSRFRRRSDTADTMEPRKLIDMSEEELFGALPQSFEGELARYKRVKREKIKT